MTSPNDSESLLSFPCDLDIKAFGLKQPGFADLILDLVQTYAPDTTKDDVRLRESKAGKYQSISVQIRAESREQLDRIYQSLSDHPDVLTAL